MSDLTEAAAAALRVRAMKSSTSLCRQVCPQRCLAVARSRLRGSHPLMRSSGPCRRRRTSGWHCAFPFRRCRTKWPGGSPRSPPPLFHRIRSRNKALTRQMEESRNDSKIGLTCEDSDAQDGTVEFKRWLTDGEAIRVGRNSLSWRAHCTCGRCSRDRWGGRLRST